MTRQAQSRVERAAVPAALLAGLVVAPAMVVAQPATFNVTGWKYELRNDVHTYACEADHCNRTSRVSYRVYEPDLNLTLAQFRDQQATVVKTLRERLPQGARIELVAADEDTNDGQRTLKVQRRTTLPDGKSEFLVSSFTFGTPRPFSLISSSVDEAAALANHREFMAPVTLMVSMRARQR